MLEVYNKDTRTTSMIFLFLYRKILVSENPLSCIFYAVRQYFRKQYKHVGNRFKYGKPEGIF